MTDRALPDGIAQRHIDAALPHPIIRWWLLLAIGAVLVAALAGAFGGRRAPAISAAANDARLTVDTPAILRNGEFFEMRFTLAARSALGQPVIALEESYWRDITVNTMIPAPAKESFADGYFVFEFEPLEAGESLEWKVDGQVNPSLFGGTAGRIEARDAERTLLGTDLRLTVLP